jgi:hypothetical protein
MGELVASTSWIANDLDVLIRRVAIDRFERIFRLLWRNVRMTPTILCAQRASNRSSYVICHTVVTKTLPHRQQGQINDVTYATVANCIVPRSFR